VSKQVHTLKQEINEKKDLGILQETYVGQQKVDEKRQQSNNEQYLREQIKEGVTDQFVENKPMFEKEVEEDSLTRKFSFKNKTISKTSEDMVLLSEGCQISFKPGQILIQADWSDQNYGQKKSKLFIQIWRGAQSKCIYQQDIFGAYER
jgi:hypothetical protein